MKSANQILNWLVIGLSQSPNSMNESFYYDKSSNEFFSILVTDYFIIDENFNIAKNTTSSYSENKISELLNRIRRIENDDTDLISVPRLTFKERKNLLIEFTNSLDDKTEAKRIEKLYLNEDRTIFNKRFEIESKPEIIDKWNSWKNEFLLSKAETFLNLNEIDINSATVMEFDEKVCIDIDLTKDEEGNIIKEKKKWWQIWK